MDELSKLLRRDVRWHDEELFERTTLRHAWAMFAGGRDATGHPDELEKIQSALDPLVARPEVLNELDDPLLADLLWRKGERVAVVEVSMQVDRADVDRADRRAATLRAAGIPAFGMVIGRDWTSDDAEDAARARSIEWRIGEDTSPGYLDFRRERAA